MVAVGGVLARDGFRGWAVVLVLLAGITSAIVGASRPEQLRETAAAADLAIDPALLAEAANILEGVRLS